MPIGQPTWRARDQPLRDPTSRWSMPGDDRGGRHGRCPPSPHPARRSPRDRPGRRSDPSAAGRGRGQRPAAGPGRRAPGPGRWARRSGTAGPQPDHAGALAGPARLPLCPGGRRLAGPDRQPPLGAAGQGQRRGPAPGRRPRPAGCRRPWPCWSPGTASGRPPGCPGLPRPKGGRRWPSGGRRPMRRSGSPMGPGCWLAPGPTSAAAGCGPTSSPGEVETLVAAGLEPCDALAAATINGGRLLGEPGAGVLAQGPADILLGHGDPLTDPGSRWRV